MSLKYRHPTFREWKEDLDAVADPDEQKAFIRDSLRHKTMLHVFGRLFFPHIIQGDYETPEAHLELIEFLSSPETGAAIFPRGFAKSSWEKIDTLHDIVYGLEPVIPYVSGALQDAQFHLESIKGELENNEWLRDVYGDLVPPQSLLGRKWTNVHFETANGVNVLARGAGKGRGVNIRNMRPTKLIIDDAESDEQVHSAMRREKYHSWISKVIMPSLDKKRGRVKIIGTVIHPECEVLKFYKGRGGIFRRAIEDGRSIWPEYWPMEDLLRLRDGYTDESGEIHEGIGLRAFSQEYLNEPINDDTSIFKHQWLDGFTYEEPPPLAEMEVRMAVDPNAGMSRMADYMAICVIGRHKLTKKRYVLAAARFKGPMTSLDPSEPTQESFFDRIYCKYGPLIAGVEKVLNQTALYQFLLSRKKYRLAALSPEGKDKVNRAKLVEPLVQQGVILFHPSHVELYNELIQFPNGAHDDLVDAFVYCNSLFEANLVKLHTDKAPMLTGNLRREKF